MAKAIVAAALFGCCVVGGWGQTFSSGSTGADGALNVTNGVSIQLPPSGILNYTTITVGGGGAVTFIPNLANTPVTLLATGAVSIAGGITVNASYGVNKTIPGPGGFVGGAPGQNGVGPGAGQIGKADGTQNGRWIGPIGLVPLVGGSGGAGNCPPYNGGSGGGAILIASSTSITVSGAITAQQAPGWCTANNTAGGDGAIRLVSNSISVSGNLQAAMVRIEAPPDRLTYTGSGTTPVLAPINPVVTPSNPPTVFISSVGGYQAPPPKSATWKTIDLMLPTQLPDPITVVVQGQNIPVGSPVALSFSGSAATAAPATATLSGSTASSSATFTVSGLSRTSVTVLFVTATFSATQIASNLGQSGPNAVDRIVVAAALGGTAKYRFLRKDGSEVNAANVSPELKRIFGE